MSHWSVKVKDGIKVWDKNRSGRISMIELEELLKNLGKDQPTQVIKIKIV